MNKRTVLLTLVFVLAVSPAALLAQGSDIPAHPKDLVYPPLSYDPPQAADTRHVLSNGAVAFLVEDHDLPLINVSLIIRGGGYLDPKDKVGLASAVGNMLRSGGTQRWKADEYDEEADFLAASVSSSMGDTSGRASVNALSKDIDQALELFFEMLRNPVFQQDRLDLYKSRLLQQLQRRNDQTASIEGREWGRLMRGADHFSNWPTTQASLDSIQRTDLEAFHRDYYHPGNFVFAVSGDFNTEEMKQKLEQAMEGWATGKTPTAIPEPLTTPEPGLYLVNKDDVNQGRVGLGHVGIMRDDPDYFAVRLMNDVLGGSGFTSRITNRVRSDEGLAYSAGSSYSAGTYYPGTFRASFQSKSETCAQATQIVLEEIERIRTQPVTEEELETVKAAAIEIFPRFFSSASAVAGTFAADEVTGRDPGYWNTYRDRLRAVTVADILRVAQKHLHPDRLVVLAVGNVEDMLAGHPDKAQFSFEKISGGKINRIPLPDPLTMIYPEQ